jgi:hypothetical protein
LNDSSLDKADLIVKDDSDDDLTRVQMSQRKAGFGWVLLGACLILSCDHTTPGEVLPPPPKGTVVDISPVEDGVNKTVLTWSQDSKSLFYLRRVVIDFSVHQVDFESKEELSVTELDWRTDNYYPVDVCVDEANGYIYADQMMVNEYDTWEFVRYRIGESGEPDKIIFRDSVERSHPALSPDGSRIGYWLKPKHAGEKPCFFATLDLETLEEKVWFALPDEYRPVSFDWYQDCNSILTALNLRDSSGPVPFVRIDVQEDWNQETVFVYSEKDVLSPVLDDDETRIAFAVRNYYFSICEVSLLTGELSFIQGTNKARDYFRHSFDYLDYLPSDGSYLAFSTSFLELRSGDAIQAIYWPEEE